MTAFAAAAARQEPSALRSSTAPACSGWPAYVAFALSRQMPFAATLLF